MTVNINNLNKIILEISQFKQTCDLLVVTKKREVSDIKFLLEQGYKIFGENRVQEAEKKYTSLRNNNNFSLHLIGPLQSNKCLTALKVFDTIQSIDRKKIIDVIAKAIEQNSFNFRTKDYYIQVNIGNESQKSGVKEEELKPLFDYAIKNKLNVIGLMCIPPIINNPSLYFEKMLKLRDNIDRNLKLSMGMSNDYKYALDKSSNMIRVGSLIFDD